MVKLCLHCGNDTNMDRVAQHEWTDEDDDLGMWENHKINIYMCPVCRGITIEREYLFSEDIVDEIHTDANELERQEAIEEAIIVTHLYPSYIASRNNIPKEVASAFESAIKVRNIDGAICAIAIRRTLEMMCKDKSGAGGNLYQMLKSLASTGTLPPILDNMASILRKLGNDAAHANEIRFDKEKVDLLVHFTKTILDNVYTLPAQLEELQTKFDSSDATAS